MPLIDCEIKLTLILSVNCVLISAGVTDQGATFSITGTKLYFPVVTVSTQGNGKLLQQLKSGFKTTIQQIDFTAYLDCAKDTRIFFILEEVKETVSDFSQGTVKVL